MSLLLRTDVGKSHDFSRQGRDFLRAAPGQGIADAAMPVIVDDSRA